MVLLRQHINCGSGSRFRLLEVLMSGQVEH